MGARRKYLHPPLRHGRPPCAAAEPGRIGFGVVTRDLLIGVGLGVILTLALLALAAWVFMRWVGKRLGSELRPAPARSLQGWDYRMRLRTLDDESIEASLF